MTQYERMRRRAELRGWHVPLTGSRVAAEDWNEAWLRYWIAMEEYERKLAAGDPDPGRPVIPHRTGRGGASP